MTSLSRRRSGLLATLREIRDLLTEIRDLLKESLHDRDESHGCVVCGKSPEPVDAVALAGALQCARADIDVLKGAHEAREESRRLFERISVHGTHDAPGGAS